MSEREKKYTLRRELAFWQRGAVILATVVVVLALTAVGVINQRNSREVVLKAQIVTLQAEYEKAKKIQMDAVEKLGAQVQAYDRLCKAIELDAEKRERQAREFEALGVYQYIGVCTLTAYCCESKDNPHICGTGDGLTATGLPVTPGVVAVDPSIIPLGSTVIINGVSYLAADTGVTGYHIDIAIQTHEEASDFGVFSAAVWIIPPGGEKDAE